MTLHATFLFCHFLGVIGLFSAGIMMHKVGSRLRRAATVEEARIWLGFARTVAVFFPVSGILILLTGLHLTATAWSFGIPWVAVALVTVLTLLPTGPLVQRPRFMAMGKAAMQAGSGPVSPDLRRALTNPLVWGLVYTGSSGALGLLWIMTQKPLGWLGAAAPVVVLGAAGAFLGSRTARRDRETADAPVREAAPTR